VRPSLSSPRPAPEQPRTPYFPPREGEESGPDAGDSAQAEANRLSSGEEKVIPPGQAGPIPPIPPIATNRSRSAGATDSGRRHPVPGHERGRYVRAIPDPSASDVALDATLRAAALRGGDGHLAIRPEDLHRKVRQERTGSLVLFVVDASGS